MSYLILGIESSCDDTSAAVLKDEMLLSNVMASQDVHRNYGGVIPELASRAHQINILPVVDQAIKQAGVKLEDIDAIAFTRGPGLLGSLLVGTSFAKGLSLAINKPLVEVNHLQGHILSHFIQQPDKENRSPEFPFLALLVSGGAEGPGEPAPSCRLWYRSSAGCRCGADDLWIRPGKYPPEAVGRSYPWCPSVPEQQRCRPTHRCILGHPP